MCCVSMYGVRVHRLGPSTSKMRVIRVNAYILLWLLSVLLNLPSSVHVRVKRVGSLAPCLLEGMGTCF